MFTSPYRIAAGYDALKHGINYVMRQTGAARATVREWIKVYQHYRAVRGSSSPVASAKHV